MKLLIFIRKETMKEYLKYYPITSVLLTVNIIIYIVLILNGGTNQTTFLKFGAQANISPWNGEYWRIFTSMFLHGGFPHLLFNCFGLLAFVAPLERIVGVGRFALIYIGSGLVGGTVSQIYFNNMVSDPTIMLGASGAIYGAYGALLYIAMFQDYLIDIASRKVICIVIIAGLIVPNVCHLGGFIGGFLIYGLTVRLLNLSSIRG